MGLQEKEKIVELLQQSGISFQLLQHAPVFTSQQAAQVRRTSLKQGVKAMVLQSNKGRFYLFCLSASQKIDFAKAAEIVKEPRLFLARPGDVFRMTGCEIGSVSPFSGLLSNLPAFFDNAILENEFVEFNIGFHTHSVRMKSKDLVALAKPVLHSFVI